MVGMTGFEPAASWSQTKRSTKLSHIPIERRFYDWTAKPTLIKGNAKIGNEIFEINDNLAYKIKEILYSCFNYSKIHNFFSP